MTTSGSNLHLVGTRIVDIPGGRHYNTVTVRVRDLMPADANNEKLRVELRRFRNRQQELLDQRDAARGIAERLRDDCKPGYPLPWPVDS